jgi:hypothetical protein
MFDSSMLRPFANFERSGKIKISNVANSAPVSHSRPNGSERAESSMATRKKQPHLMPGRLDSPFYVEHFGDPIAGLLLPLPRKEAS